LKGQGIYAFVVLVDGVTPSDELKKAIMDHVGKEVFSKPQQSVSCQHEL
jgi:acetyl-CoA synthetase